MSFIYASSPRICPSESGQKNSTNQKFTCISTNRLFFITHPLLTYTFVASLENVNFFEYVKF